MNFTLRPYQLEFKRNIAISLVKNQHVIACAPTGSGKSKIMISIAHDAMLKGRTVLIITESTKIFNQLAFESKAHEIKAGIGYIAIQPGHLYVAMSQTLVRRDLIINQFTQFGKQLLTITDEAHIGTCTTLLKQIYPGSFGIGFTATPDVRVAKHLPVLYKDCVVACQVDDLIQDGFLCTYKHIGRDNADVSILELRNGEYTEESQEKAFETSAVYDGLLDDLNNVKFHRCMIFTASIKHCEDTWGKLIEAGYSAVRYHSKLPNGGFELAKFTELGLANICVSVGALTKGFDYPAIDLIVLLRATTSLPLYLQMMGRASRPIAGRKDTFTVLDYGVHWKRGLGLYWDDRDWKTMWRTAKKKKKKEDAGVQPIKQCPNEDCGCIIPINARVCPYCGFIFDEPEEKQLAQGDLVEVTEIYGQLIGKKIGEIDPYNLSIYAKMKNKRAFAIRIARAREQTNPGWLSEFAKCMGYKKYWVDIQLAALPKEPIQFSNITIK
jgi:superfamily II DNA or RNA helicase